MHAWLHFAHANDPFRFRSQYPYASAESYCTIDRAPRRQEMLDAFLTTLTLCHTVRIDRKDAECRQRGFSFLRNMMPSRRWLRKFVSNSACGIADDTGVGLEPSAQAGGDDRLAQAAESAAALEPRRDGGCGGGERRRRRARVGAAGLGARVAAVARGLAPRGPRAVGAHHQHAEMSAYEYQASSPDEKAFVDACRRYGYVFCGVDDEDKAVLRVFERPPNEGAPHAGVLPVVGMRRAAPHSGVSSRPSSVGRSSRIARWMTHKYTRLDLDPHAEPP